MKRLVLFFFLIILMSNVLAQCSDEQININTASAIDLDKITYIGPATAIKVINARPFSSVDDLINVSGIGETKLKAIKDENLACVEDSNNEKESSEKISEEDSQEEIKTKEEPLIINSSPATINPIVKELQVIKLNSINSKDIKNNNSIQENKEEISIKKYAGFGLMALCILILILLFLQRKKDGLQ